MIASSRAGDRRPEAAARAMDIATAREVLRSTIISVHVPELPLTGDVERDISTAARASVFKGELLRFYVIIRCTQSLQNALQQKLGGSATGTQSLRLRTATAGGGKSPRSGAASPFLSSPRGRTESFSSPSKTAAMDPSVSASLWTPEDRAALFRGLEIEAKLTSVSGTDLSSAFVEPTSPTSRSAPDSDGTPADGTNALGSTLTSTVSLDAQLQGPSLVACGPASSAAGAAEPVMLELANGDIAYRLEVPIAGRGVLDASQLNLFITLRPSPLVLQALAKSNALEPAAASAGGADTPKPDQEDIDWEEEDQSKLAVTPLSLLSAIHDEQARPMRTLQQRVSLLQPLQLCAQVTPVERLYYVSLTLQNDDASTAVSIHGVQLYVRGSSADAQQRIRMQHGKVPKLVQPQERHALVAKVQAPLAKDESLLCSLAWSVDGAQIQPIVSQFRLPCPGVASLDEVSVQVETPSQVVVDSLHRCTVTVTNRSSAEMDLVLELPSRGGGDEAPPVVWMAHTVRVGRIAAGAATTVAVDLLALRPGLHEVDGITLTDEVSGALYAIEDAWQVLVVQNS